MSRTALTLIVTIGVAVAVGIYVGMKAIGSLSKNLRGIRFVDRPPDDYLELFKDGDAHKLECLYSRLNANRFPVTCYRYDETYDVLETKFRLTDTGGLKERFDLAQGRLASPAHASFETLDVGRIKVDFESFDQPDSGIGKIFLSIDGGSIQDVLTNDSVICYLLGKGYFSISRSAGGAAEIYSSKNDRLGGSGSSAPTEVLFKRRGNALFMLAASPVREQTQVPEDLLLRLTGDQ